ncbi:hypothetical protein E2R51_03945 [Jeotgalibacillus sp. S-D1]|uniref:hypothetical protein n=1 Tax=Jeotgalibacillus sp. S-D1 TaxID=2552189 RepID=UPI001059A01F|nr:hypothetical protein [Jeotgalibacillus sp. S-D1]TDL34884.1 hypothetical protein E2R51_03945 [Jeotgalibacillus sp. S-D1]
MKVEMTKDQYKKMLKAFYLGDLVLHSMKEDNEENDDQYISTEQYVMSLAKDFGFEDYVEYDESLGQFFPTPLMEQEFEVSMRKYEEEILPDQIAATLARNEVEQRLKQNKINKEEAIHLLLELEDQFLNQLEQKGFTGLYIK